jgi:hypothetical protein
MESQNSDLCLSVIRQALVHKGKASGLRITCEPAEYQRTATAELRVPQPKVGSSFTASLPIMRPSKIMRALSRVSPAGEDTWSIRGQE